MFLIGSKTFCKIIFLQKHYVPTQVAPQKRIRKKKRRDGPPQWKCPFCPRAFHSHMGRSVHVTYMHNERREEYHNLCDIARIQGAPNAFDLLTMESKKTTNVCISLKYCSAPS